MKGYKFYIAPGSFGTAKLPRIVDYLLDLSWMVVQGDPKVPEEFLHPDVDNLLAVSDAEGKDLAQEIWANQRQDVQNIVIGLIGRIGRAKKVFSSVLEMDSEYKDSHNAFTGPDFVPKSDRHVSTRQDYLDFKVKYAIEVIIPSHWERRKELYGKVRFCDGVEDAIDGIKGFQNVVTDKISHLNSFALNHWNGKFTPSEFQKYEFVRLSDETTTTLKDPEVQRQRTVSIKGLGSVCASLHFKIGSMRMNVYPDDGNKIFYITYFGPHLKTKKF